MATLVYSPGLRVVIDTFTEGLIDITDDITSGSVNRIEDGVSSASLSLANHRRKYDQIFTPNDRISIRMKRINWMVVFTGYLNKVPYFSAYTRTVNITASCSLKRVQYYLWDPYAEASAALMDVEDAGGIADGGMKKRAIALLEEVVGWSGSSRGSRIHIGKVPSDWLSQVDGLYSTVEESLRAHQDVIGADASIGGQVLTGGLGTSTQGIPGNWATGKLPYSGGKMTWFGGPQGGAYGQMQLTGESGRNPGVPEDPQGRWYMAMRWPYFKSQMAKNRPNVFWPSDKLTREQFHEAVQWWRKQRILVQNKRTGIAVVCRPADWGPAEWTGNGVDVAEHAYNIMDTQHGDEARVMFAPVGAELGPYTIRDRIFTLPGLGGGLDDDVGGNGGPGTARGRGAAAANLKVQPTAQAPYPVPPGIEPSSGSFAWGGYSNGEIPAEKMQTAVGSHRFHPIAADAFMAMRSAMQREANMTLSLTDSYRTLAGQKATKLKWTKRGRPEMAATPGTSNHGWGFATDLALPGGNSFSSRGYLWMKENASRFGWVNPPWALSGGGQEEPWHWEFWGIFNYNESTIDTAIPSLSAGDEGGGGLAGGQQRPLFNGAAWTRAPQRESSILSGPLSLMNDEPVMNTLRVLMNASGRKFCSAPNGDLIAWFPDYFGAFGTAGKMRVRTIEVEDFTIDWDDQRLKTHMFVTGAVHGAVPGSPTPAGSVSTISKFMTHGVASVEYPELVETLINVEKNTLFADGARILRRFGPRVEHQTIPTISDRQAEFWYAVHLFRQNWAEQFSASVPLSFMPELYPGMIVQIEELNFQAYVKSVSHNFNFNDGGGFSTRATLVAPATMSGSDFKELPRAVSSRRASQRSGTGD